MKNITHKEVERMARELARLNVEWESNIEEVYWFPHEEEIRLIEVDPTALPHHEAITAFYFGPDPQDGILLPSGVAVINPLDMEKLNPPDEWGDWSSAIKVWPQA